jgi:hypothetical protein
MLTSPITYHMIYDVRYPYIIIIIICLSLSLSSSSLSTWKYLQDNWCFRISPILRYPPSQDYDDHLSLMRMIVTGLYNLCCWWRL